MKVLNQSFRLVRAAGVIVMLGASLALADTLELALQRGDATAARAMLEAEVAGKPDADIHRAHLEGLIAIRSGKFRQAEAMFRAVLARYPDFEPSKVQLVIVLDKIGDPTARREARKLAETAKDPKFRNRLSRKFGAQYKPRKSGIQLRFAILPSSNITGGPDTETIMIGGLPFRLDASSRETAGTGFSVGLVGWQSWTFGRDWQLTVSGTVDRRRYDTDAKPNETEVGARLALAHRAAWGGLSFGPRSAVLFQDVGLVRRQLGIGLESVVNISNNVRLSFSAEVLRQTFPITTYRDGTLSRGLIGLSWAPKRDTVFHMNLPIEKETAAADHLSHLDLGIELGVKLHRGPVGIGISIGTSRNRYGGLYPGFDVARKDLETTLKLSVSHDKLEWQGMTPELSITRTRQNSNIPLHDTWTTDVGLSLVKRF